MRDPINELTTALEIAIARIYDILEMEERQAFKEAQKWLPYLEFVLRRNKVKDEKSI